ncbi:MAG: YidC/Oxa1 family membrane protein insertase [Patescibacteria group bacterium]|nr:YidC/Oxa1 family membrane protein insertase [Patescibacteria group bacterium]
MNFIIQFFYYILYQPLLNGLVWLYNYLPGHDFGLAIIVLTLLVKVILHPLSIKGLKSQQELAELQPKIKELQKKHSGDLQQQNKAVMELYKKHKVNPFSGCLPLLIQLPILIALYQVFLEGIKPDVLPTLLYPFVADPGQINNVFLGFLNLHSTGFIVGLAVLSGIAQFVQGKMAAKTSAAGNTSAAGMANFGKMMQTQTVYFFPLLTIFIVWKFGSAIGLYWLVSTLFSIGEQCIINKKLKAKLPLKN